MLHRLRNYLPFYGKFVRMRPIGVFLIVPEKYILGPTAHTRLGGEWLGDSHLTVPSSLLSVLGSPQPYGI